MIFRIYLYLDRFCDQVHLVQARLDRYNLRVGKTHYRFVNRCSDHSCWMMKIDRRGNQTFELER